MQKRSKNWILAILAGLFCFNVLAWLAVYDLSREQLEVIFFDIGQGDATLIKTSQGQQILIDGGPGSLILDKIGKEMPFWDKTIDLIILTHPHYDHLSGLVHVLERYQVENILWTGIVMETAVFKEWQKLIREEQAKIYLAELGQRIIAGSIILEVLHPFENLAGQKVKEQDNSSIVVKLTFKNNSFLFTGDAFKSVEEELISREINLNSNVLQVGHHGSKTSSADEFIREVLPETAVISAGLNNSYGHPHQETLDTLEKYDINILRTDLDGDITIFSDGENFKLKAEPLKRVRQR
jgi:competence protein ComEC